MGQALLQGWRRARALPFSQLMIRAPSAKPEVEVAIGAGAAFNPPDSALAAARTVVLCVKPYKLAEAVMAYGPHLHPEAVIISVLVGIKAADVSAQFGGRRVARVLPTTGVARAGGVTAAYGADPEALRRMHALFDPVSATVELDSEDRMDAAGAVSASGVAYVYAFVRALEEAALSAGLPAETARTLARSTVTSAAAYLDESGLEPDALIEQVASPAGTTRAALAVLLGDAGLTPLLRDTVAAAIRRSEELAKG